MPTSSPTASGADADALDKCLLREACSIRGLLQQLVERRCALSACAEGGSESVVTVLLAIHDSRLWIDVPRDRRLLQHWLEVPRLSLRGVLDRVSVRFTCGPAVLGEHAALPALMLPLPERLLHLQRRELMRREPGPEPLRCLVYLGEPADDDASTVATTIRDIGGGGLALLAPEGDLAPVTGDLLPRCVIELPEPFGAVEVALRIRHVREVTRRGQPLRQAGCEFVDLPNAIQARLFRYVMQLERDQRAAEKRLFD